MGFPKHKIVGIIQCRTGSKRLPNKALMPLAGKPMLWRYIERVKRSKLLDEIVLATTELQSDGVLCAIADELDIGVFTGSENDLVDRIYQCAKEYEADVIVRLCADNPLVEPEEIDRIVNHYMQLNEWDIKIEFASNVDNWMDTKYPDGLGCEVYSMKLFEIIHNQAFGVSIEHPHEFIREDPDSFKVSVIKCPKEFAYPQIKLDVNTREEYEYISAIYDKHGDNPYITDYIGDLI